MRLIRTLLVAILLASSSAYADTSAIFFGAKSVRHSESLGPALARLQEDYDVEYLDADDPSSKSVFAEHHVEFAPTIVFFEDDSEIDRMIGTASDWEEQSRGRLSGEDHWRPYRSVVRIKTAAGSGTGVVISSEPGNTIIATAAHVVSRGRMSFVELWRDSGIVVYAATVVAIDTDDDLALLKVSTNEIALPCTAVIGRRPGTGDTAFSIGCSRGNAPSVTVCRVRPSEGKHVMTNNAPQVGRSGGGLFNLDSEIIGICSAANYGLDKGWYVGAGKLKRMLLEYAAK